MNIFINIAHWNRFTPLIKYPRQICFSLCYLYQCETSYINQKLSSSVPYPILVFLTLLLMGLQYQTLRIWMGNCSISILIPLLVILSLDLCIYLTVMCGILLLYAPLLCILTVELSQHVRFSYMCSKASSKEVSNALVLSLFYPL